MRYELNFEAEPFNTYWYFDDELEVRRARIQMDERARFHIYEERLPVRFPDPDDQEKITKKINQLLTMTEPSSGNYEWYVEVGGLKGGGGKARITARGHMLRSVLDGSMSVSGTRYVIRGGELRKSGG